jgi:hypothetical protein
MLKSENKYERAENYCILFLLVGSFTLTAGIGMTAINTKGISAILAMLGSFIAFLSTIALIFTWLIKEFFGE